MNNQDEEQNNYQPTYNGILSINNYEEEQQPQQIQPTSELPLSQIQQILNETNSNRSRRQVVLILAINYLQDRCSELTNSNNYLQLRLQDMAQQIAFLHEVQIDQEIAHNFLNIMQSEILTYKQDFKQYNSRCLIVNREILRQNEELKGKIQSLQSNIFQHTQQLQYLQQQNNSLTDINGQLTQKIDSLQEQLNSRNNHHKRYYSRKLQNQIQAQLEAMIEKLMQEVENQRNQRYKLANQLKNLQHQLMQLQKQLQEKNNKIYQLQLKQIKSNRLSPQPIKNPKLRQTYENNYKTKQVTKRNDSMREKDNSNFKTFSLMRLLDSNKDFNKKTRLIIAFKVIQFFIRKIKRRQLTSQRLQNLQVHNYSSLYPQACIIRKDKLSAQQSNCSQPTFIRNLASIIDDIVHANQSQPIKPAEIQLSDFINSILQEDSCQLNDADGLLMLVEQAIRDGK